MDSGANQARANQDPRPCAGEMRGGGGLEGVFQTETLLSASELAGVWSLSGHGRVIVSCRFRIALETEVHAATSTAGKSLATGFAPVVINLRAATSSARYRTRCFSNNVC